MFGNIVGGSSTFSFPAGKVCAHDGPPCALPKPPDDGLLVADRNGDPGLGLSHGSPARVLVGVKTQEG